MASNAKTVVIADDHETSVMYLSILMRRMGFTTIPARNGEKVLQILETVRPDLVITDIKMPVMDGLTLLKTMKNNPQLSDIPIIIMTAFLEQSLADECARLGSAGFLTKPIKITELHRFLEECVIYPNNTKRKNLRSLYNQKVLVEHEGLQQEYYAITLSEQGVYLRTPKPLPVGTPVHIELPLQTEQRLKIKGAVLYRKSVFDDIDKLDPGMAIKFEGLSDQHAKELSNLITEMLTGDLLDEQQEIVIADNAAKGYQLQERLSAIKQDWQTN